MSTSSSPTRYPPDDTIDTVPLLIPASNTNPERGRQYLRRQSMREAARFLRRASSRRVMREPSMLVREAAAEQLEERQSDWAYSKPVVVMDLIWNLAFIAITAGVLVLSRAESPELPLRLWVVGYAIQCAIHMVCMFLEYTRRRRQFRAVDDNHGVAKHLESANTMFSFIWWMIGFYWVSIGGQALAMDAPQLYWLCIIFLAFDVFFIFFCVAVACVIGIAVCCCLPCIIAILYAVADQEGASRENVEQLPKYKFRKIGDIDHLNGEIQGSFAGVMTECGTDTPIEHSILLEDAECCICLSTYDDGADLRELPCGHHFHCTCVDKWLYINATCPLCKYNVLKNSSFGREAV